MHVINVTYSQQTKLPSLSGEWIAVLGVVNLSEKFAGSRHFTVEQLLGFRIFLN
jgi:hypothetical protein